MKRECGKTSGVGLADTWARLFASNERLHKGGVTPLTDEQLREVMAREFPGKRDRTTITRVGSMRGHYNKGTGLFCRRGPGKPKSHKYNGKESQ